MREWERERKIKSHENILSSSMNEWNSGIEWEKKKSKTQCLCYYSQDIGEWLYEWDTIMMMKTLIKLATSSSSSSASNKQEMNFFLFLVFYSFCLVFFSFQWQWYWWCYVMHTTHKHTHTHRILSMQNSHSIYTFFYSLHPLCLYVCLPSHPNE